MSDAPDRIACTFASRLETLAHLLDRASAQWREQGRDPEALLPARLADDMLPLAYQVAFSCEQPRQLALFWAGQEGPTLDPSGWQVEDAHRCIRETIASVRAVDTGDHAPLQRIKHIKLQQGRSLELTGADYVDDWLLPNFYFHLVTAYDILRHLGVSIGKADYMAHLRDRVRRG